MEPTAAMVPLMALRGSGVCESAGIIHYHSFLPLLVIVAVRSDVLANIKQVYTAHKYFPKYDFRLTKPSLELSTSHFSWSPTVDAMQMHPLGSADRYLPVHDWNEI